MPLSQPHFAEHPRRTKEPWPALPLEGWAETYATLHMYTQIVGKLRLQLCAPENEWWHVALYVTARGLGTSPIPHGDRTFEIELDFVDHALIVRTSEGTTESLPLGPCTVKDFYADFMSMLRALDLGVAIRDLPAEVPDPIPFSQDVKHAAYDRVMVSRWFDVIRRLDIVFKRFRGRFAGKSSPVQFFWGSFDLAVTRFSGRPAPPRPDADPITRVAYDQEVFSVGFWPGTAGVSDAALYAYAAPEPVAFRDAPIRPSPAYWDSQLKEFLLPYEEVRLAADPAAMVLDFAESTYQAAATLGGWDRAALDWKPPEIKH